MKKIITAVAVLALGASLAVAAPQDGTWMGGHGRHHGGILSPKMAARLNLSDAQKQQIQDLNKSFHTQNQAFFETARQTRKDYRAAEKANDTAKMAALRPTLDAQKAQIKQLRGAQRDSVRNILTADQRAQLDAWKAQHQKHERQP